MTDLQRALEIYDRRSQFHDRALLDKIIQAVRDEEKKKYEALHLAADVIVKHAIGREFRNQQRSNMRGNDK